MAANRQETICRVWGFWRCDSGDRRRPKMLAPLVFMKSPRCNVGDRRIKSNQRGNAFATCLHSSLDRSYTSIVFLGYQILRNP